MIRNKVKSGEWSTGAPLSQAELLEDQPILKRMMDDWPEFAVVTYMTVFVHGRLWHWVRSPE